MKMVRKEKGASKTSRNTFKSMYYAEIIQQEYSNLSYVSKYWLLSVSPIAMFIVLDKFKKNIFIFICVYIFFPPQPYKIEAILNFLSISFIPLERRK